MRYLNDMSFTLLARLMVVGALGLAGAVLAAETCPSCGVITSIERGTHEEEWQPLGVVSAAPTLATSSGAEASSAFSFSKDGKGGLVMIGAAGGAAYAKRPNSYQRPHWDVTVALDSGGNRVVQQRYEPYVKEGDRVPMIGTQMELIGEK
jgi:hypothetical protein